MDYRIDLDPTYQVLRLTIKSEIVTLQCAEDVYIHLSRIAYSGGDTIHEKYSLSRWKFGTYKRWGTSRELIGYGRKSRYCGTGQS
jgi:hypothetical protein